MQIRSRADRFKSKDLSTKLSGRITPRKHSDVKRKHPTGHEVSAVLIYMVSTRANSSRKLT